MIKKFMQILIITENILHFLRKNSDPELSERITKIITDKTYNTVFVISNNSLVAHTQICGMELHAITPSDIISTLKGISEIYATKLLLTLLHNAESDVILESKKEKRKLKICSLDISKYNEYCMHEYEEIENISDNELCVRSNLGKYLCKKITKTHRLIVHSYEFPWMNID